MRLLKPKPKKAKKPEVHPQWDLDRETYRPTEAMKARHKENLEYLAGLQVAQCQLAYPLCAQCTGEWTRNPDCPSCNALHEKWHPEHPQTLMTPERENAVPDPSPMDKLVADTLEKQRYFASCGKADGSEPVAKPAVPKLNPHSPEAKKRDRLRLLFDQHRIRRRDLDEILRLQRLKSFNLPGGHFDELGLFWFSNEIRDWMNSPECERL